MQQGYEQVHWPYFDFIRRVTWPSVSQYYAAGKPILQPFYFCSHCLHTEFCCYVNLAPKFTHSLSPVSVPPSILPAVHLILGIWNWNICKVDSLNYIVQEKLGISGSYSTIKERQQVSTGQQPQAVSGLQMVLERCSDTSTHGPDAVEFRVTFLVQEGRLIVEQDWSPGRARQHAGPSSSPYLTDP